MCSRRLRSPLRGGVVLAEAGQKARAPSDKASGRVEVVLQAWRCRGGCGRRFAAALFWRKRAGRPAHPERHLSRGVSLYCKSVARSDVATVAEQRRAVTTAVSLGARAFWPAFRRHLPARSADHPGAQRRPSRRVAPTIPARSAVHLAAQRRPSRRAAPTIPPRSAVHPAAPRRPPRRVAPSAFSPTRAVPSASPPASPPPPRSCRSARPATRSSGRCSTR